MLHTMRILPFVIALSLVSGCSWLRSNPHQKSARGYEADRKSARGPSEEHNTQPPPSEGEAPFEPTSQDSDLIFARTGDLQYYYVIDTRRELCFFHARLYGKKHLAPIECDTIPEYYDLTGRTAPITGDEEEPAAETDEAPADSPSHDPTAPTPEETARSSFRRAWVQIVCAKKAGREEPLEVLLSRHGLDTESFERLEAELRADGPAWKTLENDAAAACP